MSRYIKSYDEMLSYDSYEDRVKYLQLFSSVGLDTFGWNRFLNQDFYTSTEWRNCRRKILVRDLGCDLAIPDLKVPRGLIVHHINPITVEDILDGNPAVFDPNNLVCVSKRTHNLIHYSADVPEPITPIVRMPNDTSPWRH